MIIELMLSWHIGAKNAIIAFKREKIYWNYYLRFSIEAYLSIALLSLLRIQSLKFETPGDTILTVYAFFMFALMVAYLAISALYLPGFHGQISTPEFIQKYGTLTQGLLAREKSAMYYPSAFMLRRAIYALTIVLLSKYNFFQI